jgi:5-methylcytosine-specific restriction endonuclease McrA
MNKTEELKILRNQGLTYKQISEKTGYKKTFIAYHLNSTIKKKILERTRKIRKGEKIDRLNKYNLPQFLVNKIMAFRSRTAKKGMKAKKLFTFNQFFEKFGRYTTCYLTGDKIDLFERFTYEFDHIIPISKGGDGSLENLGITLPEANYAKGILSVNQFYELCKKVVENYKEI